MLSSHVLAAAAVVLAYLLLCWYCLRPRGRDSSRRAGADTCLVAYASQSGQAEQLAQHYADAMQPPGLVKPLNQVSSDDLKECQQAVFIASTYGDGEAPDNARSFSRLWLDGTASQQLAHLKFCVLALGDRQYDSFCAFGRHLYAGLLAHAAQPLFEPVVVDRLAPAAIQDWQARLLALGLYTHQDTAGISDIPAASESKLHACRLQARHCLNPHSPGEPIWQLELVSPTFSALSWEAGDIAVLHPRNNPSEPAREYSIASLPGEGHLSLLVRQSMREDGTPGICSHWLGLELTVDEPIDISIRRNSSFHVADYQAPAILIGNGTGLAGLRAILAARIAAGGHDNALFFGERSPEHDCLLADELAHWAEQGQLPILRRAFSRCSEQPRYVQDLLWDAQHELQDWLGRGACIYICGSLRGMARDVHRVLHSILGEAMMNELERSGRYRRDVY